ncbi:rho GTPase-activating protein REN1 [Arachis hypogaea]|uniref:rho GTPase-activating protein REN1 n=1 Tax=Arachis hypogaea TaxID=3818 RepID=UPI000DEDA951|nr:rho GTPase-activating protein REN1 [Arachis hypogaea]
MTNKSAELSQGTTGAGATIPLPSTPRPRPPEHQFPPRDSQREVQQNRAGNTNTIFKSGPLFISSKGIGWTSWKKRWFILTQNSLVFFRSDPSAVPQKGSEVNLTLGGIDLNNSGSVIVKADKKLLTVQFPDAHDGRAFTLKAETTEDLYEWKTALENALAQAPSANNMMEQNVKDKEPVKSIVIGRPILLALEDVDGTPTFLEKALRFIEEYGANVEGILRQAADVEDVERRVREYEQGKTEFTANEDAHVIGDCVKHVLRELPSSPVPASCCKALLEAVRTDRSRRVSAMRIAINDTFPEPNRRLLQRILMMMQIVASRKSVNRMSSSAVAACMAPLLLRPLLAGECEIENDFDVGGDGSMQLLQAAAAANHAQAIVITLLEEYNNIFGADGCGSPGPDIYSDSDDLESESEEATDEDLSYDEEYDDEEDESVQESDEDADEVGSGSDGENGESETDYISEKDPEQSNSKAHGLENKAKKHGDTKGSESITSQTNTAEAVGQASANPKKAHDSPSPTPSYKKSATISNSPDSRRNCLGRTSARKNLSMESIDFTVDDDEEVEKLEYTKKDLQNQIAEETKANENLQSHIDNRKKSLLERRMGLEQEVIRLQEQLVKVKNARANNEIRTELGELTLIEMDLANFENKVIELGMRLNVQLERKARSTLTQPTSNHERKSKSKVETEVVQTSQFERSTSKDTHLSKAETVNERKSESKHPPSGLKKSGSKGEVRRSQELPRNPDRGKGSELNQTHPSPVPNQEKPRGLDSSQSLQIPERSSSKGKSHQSSDKLRKSDSQPSRSPTPKHLERGISESHLHNQSYNVDKGR